MTDIITNKNKMHTEDAPIWYSANEKHDAELMLDSIPMLCSVWNEEGKIVDCNLEALRLFGLKSKSDYIKRFYELSPKFQADGSPSDKKIDALVHKALSAGFQRFEWEFRTARGERLPMSAHLIRVAWRGGYRILFYSRDLREIKMATERIDWQSKLLRMINTIAVNLMVSDTDVYDQIVRDQLRILGDTIGADRVSLWENHDLNDKRFAHKIYEWISEAGRLACQSDFASSSLDYESLPYFHDMMHTEHVINNTQHKLPKRERLVLEGSMNKAMLAVPISYTGLPWGFIMLENIATKKTYLDIEEQVLRSCGFLMVSSIIRSRTTQALMDTQKELMTHEKLLLAVNEVAAMLLNKEESDYIQMLGSCMRILAGGVDAGRVSLWRNHEQNGRIHARCLINWSGETGISVDNVPSFIDLEDYIPEWTKDISPHRDLDLPMHRMNAKIRESPFWQSAKSLLFMPLYIEGSFWGFFSFVYLDAERRFTQEERNILWTGSLNIASALVRKEIQEDLKVEKIKATYDPLTKVENRRSFYPRAQKIFDEHKYKTMALSVLFLDIDHFKRVNDQYGHDFGDQVLVAFADMLKKSIRPKDLLCRYGGEEFLMLMPDTDKEGGMALCQRIMDRVGAIAFAERPSFHFTTSIGMMTGVPEQAESLGSFIKKADKALYTAKHEGRNRVALHQ